MGAPEANASEVDAIGAGNADARFDAVVRELLQRMPDPVARRIRSLLQPKRRWIRLPAGLLLIAGGLLGFLPVLGFWMAPVGCVVLACDVPPLKRYMAPALEWGLRKWDAWRSRGRPPERVGNE